MIISIDENLFDTDKAEYIYNLERFDGRNILKGKLYITENKKVYVNSPTQWSEDSWRIIKPKEAIEYYQTYLTQEEIKEIVDIFGLEIE